MLCSNCLDLFAGRSLPASYRHQFVHHSSLQSLQASAHEKCRLCSVLYDRFDGESYANGSHDGLSAEHSVLWITGGQGKRIYFYLARLEDAVEKLYTIERAATFDLIPASELDLAASHYKATATTISDSSISLAREWHDRCLREHIDYCAKGTQIGGYFPTRILDVNASSPDTVKLLLTYDDHLEEPYVTLSHCWGKSEILTLETGSLEEFIKGISLHRLPKTFRDAIQVVRAMGHRYLWIDSLCILQDSKEDWLRESAVMGKIYRNGTLNIAATAASGGEEGLDWPRDPLLSQHLRLTATWDGPLAGTRSEIPTRGDNTLPEAGDYYLVENDFWIRDVDRAPLNTRGWVLQERLLAPRILHFGRNQLYWQCGLDALCEMFPKDINKHRLGVGPIAYTARDLRPFVQVLASVKESPWMLSDAITMEEVYQPWRTLVTEYSEMNLTKGEDKLIAIQALAQTMQDAIQDRYIAGMWESRLVEDFLWRAMPEMQDRPRITRPKEWRAPSWSWASIDGPVKKAALTGRYAGHKQFDGTVLVEDLRADILGAHVSTTGQLRSASLTLRGSLLQSLQQELIARPFLQQQTGVVSHFSIELNGKDRHVLNVWPDEFNWAVAHSTTYTLPSDTVFLAVGKYNTELNKTTTRYLEGFVLTPAKDDAYIRIGYFCLGSPVNGTLIDVFRLVQSTEPIDFHQTKAENLPKSDVTIL